MKPTDKTRRPSLADYLVRHDLKSILEDARLDYAPGGGGAPRLLNQKDIAARFRKSAAAPKRSHS